MERAALARLLGAPGAVAEARGPIVVEAREPARFQAALTAAVAAGGPVFLADPAWGAAERAALAELTGRTDDAADDGRGWLMIASGGTGGRLKFARHDQDTISAAVRGFSERFRAGPVNSVGVLPLHHVSGLMAWMRAALTGGEYVAWDWKRLEAGERPAAPRIGGGWFLSLVPTQLQRLLPSAEARAWLGRFDAVFIGGGPLWPELADEAARAGLPLSPSYGLTETAAMVAALAPVEFRAGGRSSGAPLPHARLDLTPEGVLRITGESVCHGYFPDRREKRAFVTDDLARFDERGGLHVLGRRDALIITGGEKVDPQEVEAALRSTGEFSEVAVVGLPDPDWGQAVVACYPATGHAPDRARVEAALRSLAPFKRPRRIVALAEWPRNAQGKLNRAALARLAAATPV